MSDQGAQSNWSYYALGGLLVLWLLLVLYFYGPSREPSPDELENTALTAATIAEKEKAAVKLASLGPKSLEHLRRLVKQTPDVPVRAACIQGLGTQWDYESMEVLLAALHDEAPAVRGNAGVIVQRMLGLSYGFKAEDPPAKRTAMAKSMEETWKRLQGSAGMEDWKKRVREMEQQAAEAAAQP